MFYLKLKQAIRDPRSAISKLLVACFLPLAALLIVPDVSLAQAPELAEEAPRELRAVITGPSNISQGKKILLDASHSTADPETVSYKWMRDGEVISNSEEALLTLNEPGKYKITLQVSDLLSGIKREAEVNQDITVYKRKLILVAGPNVDKEKLEQSVIREVKEELGINVKIIKKSDKVYEVFPTRACSFHTINFVYYCEIIEGNPKSLDETTQVKWFKPSEIKKMKLAYIHKKILKKEKII